MTEDAAILATYETYKHIPSRKVVQIVLEVAAEGQEALFKALGYPDPQKSIWVAVARVNEAALQPAPVPEIDHKPEPPANDDRTPRPLSQVSAILCGIVAFRRFIHEAKGYEVIPTVDEAATWVREMCGVKSRSEFDTDESAAANFRRIRSEYDAWLRAA